MPEGVAWTVCGVIVGQSHREGVCGLETRAGLGRRGWSWLKCVEGIHCFRGIEASPGRAGRMWQWPECHSWAEQPLREHVRTVRLGARLFWLDKGVYVNQRCYTETAGFTLV